MVAGGNSLGVKRPGREADHSPPSSTEVKNGGAIPPLPHISSWCSAELIKHRDTLPYNYLIIIRYIYQEIESIVK
jgi:hypothetical protein